MEAAVETAAEKGEKVELFVSALDPSGNHHLGKLCRELHRRGTPPQLKGIFSTQLHQWGKPIVEAERLGVMGFLELIPKLGLLRRALREGGELGRQANRVLLIDAPSFNLRLAAKLRPRRGKIYYYILPKVWAWKRGRISVVEQLTDYQLYIFPFESRFWRRGVYIGNPILEGLTPPTREELARRRESRVIGFFPGSRPMEIGRLMPLYRQLGARLSRQGFQLELVVPPHLYPPPGEIYGDLSLFHLSTSAAETLSRVRFAYICSGTATLEGALRGVPLALLYRASPLDYRLGRLLVRGISSVGLANIIGEFEGWGRLHPEYLQHFPLEELLSLPLSPDFDRSYSNGLRLWDYFKTPATPNLAELLSQR